MKKHRFPSIHRLFKTLECYPRGRGRLISEAKKRVARFVFIFLERLSVPFETRILGGTLPNCYRISNKLYRGGQPGPEGFAHLKRLGVNTAVNLRTFDSNLKASIESHHLPFNLYRPTCEQLVEFIRIVHQSEGPVYIHCFHGSDRTGLFVALYRIVFQGWSKEQALVEMKSKEFGFHSWCIHLAEYLEKLNIHELIYRAGIELPEEGLEALPRHEQYPPLPQTLEAV